MVFSFSDSLNQAKQELGFTQIELCKALFDIPHRTLQSWLQGEKEPPVYVQNLILFRLKILLNDNNKHVKEP